MRDQELVTPNEGKNFLITKVRQEALRRGILLSDEDCRVLSFSVDDPDSAVGISPERLSADDSVFERKITGLLRAAYQREAGTEGTSYKHAIQAIRQGDHYLAIMAGPDVTRNRKRDLLLCVLTALGIVTVLLVVIIWNVQRNG